MESFVKQHCVSLHGKSQLYFKEIRDPFIPAAGGMQIFGQAETVTEFVNNSGIEDYLPYGYCLQYIHRNEGSKNMTAYLYKLGTKFYRD